MIEFRTKMTTNTPIPERLKKRPVWNGMVVPYTVLMDANGIPMFKTLDEKLRRRCLSRELCAICGEKLEAVVCFIGGEQCCKYKCFTDPGMHKECAEYSAKTCPFLRGGKRHYSEQVPKLGDNASIISFGNSLRPARMAIFYTRSWKAGTYVENGNVLLHAVVKKFFKVDWNIMPESTIPGESNVKPVSHQID